MTQGKHANIPEVESNFFRKHTRSIVTMFIIKIGNATNKKIPIRFVVQLGAPHGAWRPGFPLQVLAPPSSLLWALLFNPLPVNGANMNIL